MRRSDSLYTEKNTHDPEDDQQAQTQRDMIIQKLKDRGNRLTRQRLMLLDIILEDECSCCKEIYYRAVSRNQKVGLATVYRMVNMLEEIGAISRKNMYKVVCGEAGEPTDAYTVEFDDGTRVLLSAKKWYQIVRTGLRECGYLDNRDLRSVKVAAR